MSNVSFRKNDHAPPITEAKWVSVEMLFFAKEPSNFFKELFFEENFHLKKSCRKTPKITLQKILIPIYFYPRALGD